MFHSVLLVSGNRERVLIVAHQVVVLCMRYLIV